LVPAIPRLAVDQYDLGCFTDPKYVHDILVDTMTPVNQPPMRMTPDQEAWVEGWT
jgi:hypothetical protein